jgi:hypothetical protein
VGEDAPARVGDEGAALEPAAVAHPGYRGIGQSMPPQIAACTTGAPTKRPKTAGARCASARLARSMRPVTARGGHAGMLHQFEPPTTTSTRPRRRRAVCVRMNSQHTAAPTLKPAASMTPSSDPPT